MLTRSGVAKCLGCSLATVRRLEGVELFPRRDLRGFHRFDETQVSEVKRRLARGLVESAQGTWLRQLSKLQRHQTLSQSGSARVGPAKVIVTDLEKENAALFEYVHELETKLAELYDALID